MRFVQAIAAGAFLLAGLYYVLPSLIIGRGVIVIAALTLVVRDSGLATRVRMAEPEHATARAVAPRRHQRCHG